MNRQYRNRWALTAMDLFFAAAMAMGLQQAMAADADAQDSAQVQELLKKTEAEAALLDLDSRHLVAFQRSRLSWESHATQLELIKEHVNKVGKLEEQLRDARESGCPWQQEAIDRVNPLLRELAGNLEGTISHLNRHQSALFASPYPEYVTTNAELVTELHEMISDFVDYGKTKQTFQQLQQRLELAKN
jgi:hypothetical protein